MCSNYDLIPSPDKGQPLIKFDGGAKILLIVLMLFANNIKSQTGVVLTAVDYPQATEQWTICEEEGGDFGFTLGGLPGSTNIQLNFGFSPGFEYIPGSFFPTPLTEDLSDLNNPIFTIPDIAPTELTDIQLKLKMNCEAASFLQEGDNEANFTLSIDSDGGTNSFGSGVPPFTPFTNSVKIPFLTILPIKNITPAPILGLGDSFERTLEIRQTGVRAEVYNFTICLDHQSGIGVQSQTFNNFPFNLINGCLDINESNAADFGIILPLLEGDKFLLTEEVTLEECQNLSSLLSVQWGCNDELCQDFEYEFGAAINNDPVIFKAIEKQRTILDCPLEGAEILSGWEIESGSPAEGAFQLFSQGISTFIDPYSIEISIDDIWIPVPRSIFYGNTFPSIINPCVLPSQQYKSIKFDWNISDLEVGDEILLRYNLKYCCENFSSINAPDDELFGAFTNISVAGGCGIGTNFNANINTIDLSTVSSSFNPSTLVSGNAETFRFFLEQLPNLEEFQSKGQLCVQITTPQKINIVPGSVQWLSPFGFSEDVTIASENVTINSPEEIVTEICFDGLHGDNSQLTFQTDYNCDPSNCGGEEIVNVKIGFKNGLESCTDKCLIIIEESNTVVKLSDECCPEVANCTGVIGNYTKI